MTQQFFIHRYSAPNNSGLECAGSHFVSYDLLTRRVLHELSEIISKNILLTNGEKEFYSYVHCVKQELA
jgi:hypothetical protein